MDKVMQSAAQALDGLESGMRIAVGGFGVCGIPSVLIAALLNREVSELEVVSNNCGVDDWGLGLLLREQRIRRVVASYVGENKEFARQYLAGELEVELTPQGTLAERLRCAGVGIPAFYTRTGIGTQVADGGLPWRYDAFGEIALASPPKEQRAFTVRGAASDYVLEESLPCDFALIRAAVGDRHGNLVFHESARNFNPVAAMAGKVAIAEVERLVEPGEIEPDDVHLPGVFIHRVVPMSAADVQAKRIERVTTRPRAEI